ITSDAILTVHLRDLGTSGAASGFANYEPLRGPSYTYTITVQNSSSIYAEVEDDNEREPGQEGFVLLTNDEIVNADCHYEYHSITFNYSPSMTPEMFSWYIKTPFSEGGPQIVREDPNDPDSPVIYNAEGLDYRWVMFSINDTDGDAYLTARHKYPGMRPRADYPDDWTYDENWTPSSGDPHPKLMDINQLIEYVFDQTKKKTDGAGNDFLSDIIRATIYIDEYYYEKNPITGDVDPDLWREFVNAKPREMHILSDARPSRDRKSDVILSSHSIIQQSIQTIYNIFDPTLRTLWGTEHRDEIKEKAPEGWTYWADPSPYGERAGANNDLGRENGRLNSAYIWKVRNSNAYGGADINNVSWDTYLNFGVDNNTPEIRDDYHGMAWSCLSRNRDNNGDGVIDRDEVRWYMAAANQLVGMWVGRYSLTSSASLYQPAEGEWRAHVMSSTDKRPLWAEEGATFGAYGDEVKPWPQPAATWGSYALAAHGESVRCLRNIGTYDDGGVVTDVSHAEYNFAVDQYYTVSTPDEGRSYVMDFSRLDPRSIREYSAEELPYHDQNSSTNRVYVKLFTQSLDDDVDKYNETMETVNPKVTTLGYNPFCPPGYRFPNHTEIVLMAQLLPSWYFTDTKDVIWDEGQGKYRGVKYSELVPSESPMFPSRTYYDRGYYGALRSESQPWQSEKDKVGWAVSASDRIAHCQETAKPAIRSRCVRDDGAMVGNISGIVTTEDALVRIDEPQQISFNFSSTESAISYASLKLSYTTDGGNYREIDIPVEKTPSGLQYRETQTINIPSASALGISTFPATAHLQATVRNVAGKEFNVDLPITLMGHIADVGLDLPTEFHLDNGFPIHLTGELSDPSRRFTGVKLCYKKSGDANYTEVPLYVDVDSGHEYDNTVWLKDVIGSDAVTALEGTTYNFKFAVSCNDGSTSYSDVMSVETARYNFQPNPYPKWKSGGVINSDPEHPWNLIDPET
ncbi:MAG: hypothetical protein K6G79_07320, partial [Bacteroidales bacterium]|nr:hypothetical protein [Bacteroidales bacterium]